MKRIKAIVWPISGVQGNNQFLSKWLVFQVVFELSPELMKILGLPDSPKFSMYMFEWTTRGRKIPRTLLPKAVIDDAIHRECGTFVLDGLYVAGEYGFKLDNLKKYYKEITPEVAIGNGGLLTNVSRFKLVDRSSKELIIDNPVLTKEAQFFISHWIGKEALWGGREYMYKVMQFSKKDKEASEEHLQRRYIQMVKDLIKYYGLAKNAAIIEDTKEIEVEEDYY